MHIKKKDKSRGLYTSLILSYVLVLVIPLGLSIACFHFAYRTIYQETSLYQKTLLLQVQDTMDGILESMISDAEIICANSNLSSLHQKETYSGSDRFAMNNLRTDLKSIQDSEGYYSDVGVLLGKTNTVITGEEVYAEPLVEIYRGRKHLSKDFFERMKGTQGYFIEKRNETEYLTTYRSFYDSNLQKTGAVYLSVNLKSIASQLKNLTINAKSLYYIQTRSGEIIDLTDFTENLEDIEYIENPDPAELLRYEDKKGIHYFRQAAASEVYALNYGSCVPKSMFFAQLYRYMLVMAAETVFALIIGICLIRYFSKKNYSPVEKMQRFLEKNLETGEIKKSEVNYQSIENGLQNFIKERNSTKNLLKKSEQQIENGKIAALLRGNIPFSEWVMEYIKKQETLKGIKKYCIVVFAFDHLLESPFLKGEVTEHSYELLVFLVKNVIDDNLLGTLDGKGEGISLRIENNIAAIFSMERLGKEETVQRIESCISFFKVSLSVDTIVGISQEYTEWEKLPAAYDEANIALAHKRFWENSVGNVIFYEDTDSETADAMNYGYTEQMGSRIRKVINNILANNTELALQDMNELCEQCFSRDIHMLRFNQLQAFMITGILLNTVYSAKEEALREKKIGEYEKKLMDAQSLHELQSMICEMLEETIQLKSQKETNNPEWVEQVMTFVKESYANPELNIAYIANIFNMPSASMGQQFKKYTGGSLIHYIHYVRIEHAKELLKEGKTLQECVDQIGFSDVKTFIRIFKQYEGVTPGQYKTSIQ